MNHTADYIYAGGTTVVVFRLLLTGIRREGAQMGDTFPRSASCFSCLEGKGILEHKEKNHTNADPTPERGRLICEEMSAYLVHLC